MINWLKVGLFVASVAFAGVVKYFWPNYPDDNVVEEKIEEVIKEKTGVDVDLTPLSPENPNKNP